MPNVTTCESGFAMGACRWAREHAKGDNFCAVYDNDRLEALQQDVASGICSADQALSHCRAKIQQFKEENCQRADFWLPKYEAYAKKLEEMLSA